MNRLLVLVISACGTALVFPRAPSQALAIVRPGGWVMVEISITVL